MHIDREPVKPSRPMGRAEEKRSASAASAICRRLSGDRTPVAPDHQHDHCQETTKTISCENSRPETPSTVTKAPKGQSAEDSLRSTGFGLAVSSRTASATDHGNGRHGEANQNTSVAETAWASQPPRPATSKDADRDGKPPEYLHQPSSRTTSAFGRGFPSASVRSTTSVLIASATTFLDDDAKDHDERSRDVDRIPGSRR